MSIIRELAAYVAGATYEDLSQAVTERARERVLDFIGVVFSGYARGYHRPMWPALHGAGGTPEASVIGEGVKLPAAAAAFLNSAMCNGLADGSRFSGLHPAVTVLPAALATLEAESGKHPPSGADLLLATTLGYEVMIRIGRAMNPSSVLRGFHPTSVIGPIGAAAAAARLLRLDAAATANALSIACLLGSGLVSAFNAPRSYVQIQQARAAEAGVQAARFAAAGAPGKENILEEDFVRAYADDYQLDGITRDLGVDFMLPQTYLVMHYGCRHLHAPIDATVQIVKEQGLAPGDIAEIRVSTYRVAIELAIEEPKNAEEAGFSNGFAIAVALLYGDAFQHRFSKAYMAEPKVQDLMSRVKVAHDPELDKEFPGKRAAVVTLLTRDGREFRHRLDLARGDPEIPFTAAEIEAKFQHMARGVINPDTARRIIDYVNQIEQAPDISPLIALLKAETGA